MPGSAPESGASRNAARGVIVAAGAQHHALRHTEAHLARREVGDHHHQPAGELFGPVGGADAGEHRALLVAQIQRQAQQLVGALHQLGRGHARDAQVELREVVDARCDGRRGCASCRRGRCGAGSLRLRRAGCRPAARSSLDQRGDRLRVQPRRQRLIAVDRLREQRRCDGAPSRRIWCRETPPPPAPSAAAPGPDSSSARETGSSPGWRWRAPHRRAPDPWRAPRACADRCSDWRDRPAP